MANYTVNEVMDMLMDDVDDSREESAALLYHTFVLRRSRPVLPRVLDKTGTKATYTNSVDLVLLHDDSYTGF